MRSFLLWSGHVVIFIVIWSWGHFYCDLVMLSLFLFFYQLEFTFTALGLASIIILRQRCFLQFQIRQVVFVSGLWIVVPASKWSVLRTTLVIVAIQNHDWFSKSLLSLLPFKINHAPLFLLFQVRLTCSLSKKAKNQYSFVFCSFLWLLNLEPLNERYATEQQHKACMYFGLWVCTVPIFFQKQKVLSTTGANIFVLRVGSKIGVKEKNVQLQRTHSCTRFSCTERGWTAAKGPPSLLGHSCNYWTAAI